MTVCKPLHSLATFVGLDWPSMCSSYLLGLLLLSGIPIAQDDCSSHLESPTPDLHA